MRRLKTIVLPDTVTDVDSQAFSNCYTLETVVLSSFLEPLNYDAFYNCNNLTNIYYPGTEDDWENVTFSTSNEDCLECSRSEGYFNLDNEDLQLIDKVKDHLRA